MSLWENNGHISRLNFTVEKLNFLVCILDLSGSQPFDRDMDRLFFCVMVMMAQLPLL